MAPPPFVPGPGSPGSNALQRLHAAHERLADHLYALMDAVGADPINAQAITDVLAHAQRSVTRHEADEEMSLFPRLAGLADDTVAAALRELVAEHATHAMLWQQLQAALEAGDLQGCRQAAGALQDNYARHMQLEETVVFTAAGMLLTGEVWWEIGEEMDARRQERGSGRGGGGGGRGSGSG